MNNISIKVAYGIALPNPPEATYHGNPVPPSYARVRVDEILSGYDALNLDFPGGEGDQTLIEAKHGYFLWRKQRIIIPEKGPSPAHQLSPPHPPETERSATPRCQSSPPPPPEREPSGRTRRRYRKK